MGVCLLLLILFAYQNSPSPNTAEGINILMTGFEYTFENLDLQMDFEKGKGSKEQASIILVSVLALLILGAYSLFQLLRRKQHVEIYAALFENLSQQQRLDTFQSFRKNQEKELGNIPRRLSDEVGGPTSQLELKGFASKSDAANKLKTTQKLLSDLSGTIRSINHTQASVALERGGLKPAILDLFTSINATNKTQIEELIIGLNDTDAWHQDLCLSFYQIIQEILSNIIQHSTATHVLVQIIELKKSMTIYIEDNGKSLKNIEDKDEPELNFLLSNIAFLKGTVEINTTENQRNFVLIELPPPLGK